ncbi:MAG: DNA repair protein RecN, partial [Clostridiales bacterium]|nr:DNA repair protein RecN [Clostridiales bacterium]
MLLNLHVKNLALIDEIEVEFEKGLNILSGETGAGKSILLGSVNLALGGKITRDMIRDNTDFALVELVFQINDLKKINCIKEMGFQIEEDGLVIISRKITPGRGISKINGETVTVTDLRELTSLLLDIHGQHDHQSLLNKSKHLEILDEYASRELLEIKGQMELSYKKYKNSKETFESFNLDETSQLREIAFLQFEIDEIERAALKVNEDATLENQFKKIDNSKRIIEALTHVYEEIGYNSFDTASVKIGRAVKELNSIVQYDDSLIPMKEQLEVLDNLCNDISRDVSTYVDSLEFDQEAFTEIENRLDMIHGLQIKYGATIEKILAYRQERIKKLNILENYQSDKASAAKELQLTKEKVLSICQKMSVIRKDSAKTLNFKIQEALGELNFLNTKFEIQFNKGSSFSKNGYDEIEFLISTNVGEGLKPLKKVASGGELSRVMLAIKAVLATKDQVDTLIFDEIDTGISGRTAQSVSEKLKEISKHRQVICITHLAQIAAMADNHFLIEKSVKENRTITDIRKLAEEEMIQELARILGGAEITQMVIDSAKEMKEL